MPHVLIVDDQHSSELQEAFADSSSSLGSAFSNFVCKIDQMSAEDALRETWPSVLILDAFFPKQHGLNAVFSAGSLLEKVDDACRNDKNKQRPITILVSNQSEFVKRFEETVVHWLDDGRIDDVMAKSMAGPGLKVFQKVLRYRVEHFLSSRPLVLAAYNSLQAEHQIVTRDPAMLSVWNEITKFAPSKASVLILGETGTGKELVAKAIHKLSPRALSPYITVNCAKIPDDLIESELFGHERGSFTGANQRQIGKFEQANLGTIFLDEVGDMSLKAQAKVLRVLENNEMEIERLGSRQTINVDVRVVAATKKDLREEIRNGNFRDDLYFRLATGEIKLPPLRRRRKDIPFLTDYFLTEFNTRERRSVTLSDQVRALFNNRYSWPGNIRELQRAVENIVIVSDVPVVTVEALSATLQEKLGVPEDDLGRASAESDVASKLNDLGKQWLEALLSSIEKRKQDKDFDPAPTHCYRALTYILSRNDGATRAEIEGFLDLGQAQVGKVLKVLVAPDNHGLVICRPDGRKDRFKLNPDGARELAQS
jgi:DNA-binding NtrC family response regulator